MKWLRLVSEHVSDGASLTKKRWRVCSPEYGTVIPVTDDGRGPLEYGCDVVEVEATTKRDAVILGVRAFREKGAHYLGYCNGSPFTGVTAEPLTSRETDTAKTPTPQAAKADNVIRKPTFDSDGYPSADTLRHVRTRKIASGSDADAILLFVKDAWHYPQYASYALTAQERHAARADSDQTFLRLATGGWSGNEDLITAMRENRPLWLLRWRLSATGGLHIFGPMSF